MKSKIIYDLALCVHRVLCARICNKKKIILRYFVYRKVMERIANLRYLACAGNNVLNVRRKKTLEKKRALYVHGLHGDFIGFKETCII